MRSTKDRTDKDEPVDGSETVEAGKEYDGPGNGKDEGGSAVGSRVDGSEKGSKGRPEGRSVKNREDMSNGHELPSQDELLFIVRAAQQSLPNGINNRIEETLAFVEGMAPFLDKDTIMRMKCKHCDFHSSSFFPLDGDFDVVDAHEYCHAKQQPFHRLNIFTVARCLEYTTQAQKATMEVARRIVEEDLRPMLSKKRLYNRNRFASFNLDFHVCFAVEGVFIEFGHREGDKFVGSDVRLLLVNRLDPGLGPASGKIAEALKKGNVMVVEASESARRFLDLDSILKGIGEKRKMDIIYL